MSGSTRSRQTDDSPEPEETTPELDVDNDGEQDDEADDGEYDGDDAFRDHRTLAHYRDYLLAHPTRKGTAPVRELTEHLALRTIEDVLEHWSAILPAEGTTRDDFPFACALNNAFARRTVERILRVTDHPALELAFAAAQAATDKADTDPK